MTVAECRQQMQSQLDHARTVRGEMDAHISDLKLEINNWMDAMLRAIVRERMQLNQSNSIADGELESPFVFLMEKVGSFEQAKQRAADLDSTIAGYVQELADRELWTE